MQLSIVFLSHYNYVNDNDDIQDATDFFKTSYFLISGPQTNHTICGQVRTIYSSCGLVRMNTMFFHELSAKCQLRPLPPLMLINQATGKGRGGRE